MDSKVTVTTTIEPRLVKTYEAMANGTWFIDDMCGSSSVMVKTDHRVARRVDTGTWRTYETVGGREFTIVDVDIAARPAGTRGEAVGRSGYCRQCADADTRHPQSGVTLNPIPAKDLELTDAFRRDACPQEFMTGPSKNLSTLFLRLVATAYYVLEHAGIDEAKAQRVFIAYCSRVLNLRAELIRGGRFFR